MDKRNYSEITPQIAELSALCAKSIIDPSLYTKFKVNRGLRDLEGNGVLTGLTEISEVVAKKKVNGEEVPCEGELYYRGYNVKNLVEGFENDGRPGFEETVYLLLFGELPTWEQLDSFMELLSSYRSLPNSFVRDIIMKKPSTDIMNAITRSVLTLYSYDENPEDISVPNVLRQSLQLISMFPLLAVYGYQAHSYYTKNSGSLVINDPVPELSLAENILYMLHSGGKYTKLEAQLLDLCLVLHAEHGGGNNSSFTMHVVTSSGTDTYSAVAAALASLKGPKHGGANIYARKMFKEIREQVKDWKDDDEIGAYLKKILHKEAFDKTGLIYGIGHAVYSLSDPRAEILKNYAKSLAVEKGLLDEFLLYDKVDEIAPKIIADERRIYKGISTNVDFRSGFIYDMLGIPEELYTPIFAVARIAGWSAHRLEELINAGKIIRPAYKAVSPRRDYIDMNNRG